MKAHPNSLKNLKLFKKGESGNYKGRPKRGISAVNEQLIKDGYNPATKSDIESNFMSLLNADESKLKELLADPKQPMLVRIVIKNILGGKGYEIADKMMDRAIGKAVQKEEVKLGDDNIIKVHIIQ